LKHLPKHLRPRWRYLGIGIEAWPDAAFDRRAFQRALWESARSLLGDPGSAAADLSVLGFEFDDGEGGAVVRARRGEVPAARAALACVDAVDGHPVGIRVRGASGTVRACEERYLGRWAGPCAERRVGFEDAHREAVVCGDAIDVILPAGFAGATDLDCGTE